MKSRSRWGWGKSERFSQEVIFEKWYLSLDIISLVFLSTALLFTYIILSNARNVRFSEGGT